MKIITLSSSNNYGAVLQNFALSKKLREYNCDVETLRIQETEVSKFTYLRRPVATLQKIIGLGFDIKRLLTFQASYAIEIKPGIFNDFREEFIGVSKRIYNYEDLEGLLEEPFAYIVGSDAVWSSDAVFKPPIYLLKFAKNEQIKKIAYAASFGKGTLEKYQHEEFRQQLGKFVAIGVRERSGQEIIKKLDHKLLPVRVLDPTFLITDYSEILSEKLVPSNRYLVLYRLNQDNYLAKKTLRFVEKFAEKHRLIIINISPESNRPLLSPHISLNPSPGEFLGLIKNAEFVFTNSFHGVVFALKLQKDFVCFARDQFKDKKNLRMIELLEAAGLLHRFFPIEKLNLPTVFSGITSNSDELREGLAKLSPLINSSKEFLDQQFSESGDL
ncbi:MAG: polysaccharide pyruvyl transferase family protein [Parvibaculales bacterium]